MRKCHQSTLLLTTTCKFFWCYKAAKPELLYKCTPASTQMQSRLNFFFSSTIFYPIK